MSLLVSPILSTPLPPSPPRSPLPFHVDPVMAVHIIHARIDQLLSIHAGIMRFYTDDAPGLRIGPTVVLVFSLAFIGCVVLLHIWGKFKG